MRLQLCTLRQTQIYVRSSQQHRLLICNSNLPSQILERFFKSLHARLIHVWPDVLAIVFWVRCTLVSVYLWIVDNRVGVIRSFESIYISFKSVCDNRNQVNSRTWFPIHDLLSPAPSKAISSRFVAVFFAYWLGESRKRCCEA